MKMVRRHQPKQKHWKLLVEESFRRRYGLAEELDNEFHLNLVLDNLSAMAIKEDPSLHPDLHNPGSGSHSSSSGHLSAECPSGEETVLATAGYDHTIKLWSLHTALCLKTLQHPDSQVNRLALSSNRKLVGAAGYQHIRIYDVLGTGSNPTLNFEGLSKNVTTLGFNDSATWMFSGGEDCFGRIWDLRSSTPQCQKVFETSSAGVTSGALHPNGACLILGDSSGTIHVWDLRNDDSQLLIPDQGKPVALQSVAIDQKGEYLASVNSKGDCYVWNLLANPSDGPVKLNPHDKKTVHKKYALTCHFSPDSKLLATTSADQTCKVWKMEDFSLFQELGCSGQRWVWDAAFTGDSQFVLTASSDNLARLWSLETGQCKREYNGHQKPVTCVAFRDPSIMY